MQQPTHGSGTSPVAPDGVLPDTLRRPGAVPRPLQCRRRISELIEGTSLKLRGEDREITRFGPLSSLARSAGSDVLLTYLTSPAWAQQLRSESGQVFITHLELAGLVPPGNTLLVTDSSPQESFYTLFAERGVPGYERLASWISPGAIVEPSAVIGPHVWIEAEAYVGHNAVVLPNSYVGRGVIIQPNTTVGGDGFEPKSLELRLRKTPHAGGAWLDEGVEVGSNACIDRGLFGEFTYLGRDTKVDNLVNVSHAVTVGERTCLGACAQVSGSVVIHEGVWIGPHTSVNQLLTVGAHSYIGTGSIVTRDVQPHALAFGTPAKRAAWVCTCREKLVFDAVMRAECGCGRRFALAEGAVTRLS